MPFWLVLIFRNFEKKKKKSNGLKTFLLEQVVAVKMFALTRAWLLKAPVFENIFLRDNACFNKSVEP